FSRYIDLNAATSQQTAVRSRPADPSGQLPGGGGLAPLPETEQTTAINAAASWPQKLDSSLSPPGFLKLASAAASPTAKSQSINGKKYTVVSFPVDAKAPSGIPYTISGYINEQNMIEKIQSTVEEPNLIGDMVVEQRDSEHENQGAAKFTMIIVQMRADRTWEPQLRSSETN